MRERGEKGVQKETHIILKFNRDQKPYLCRAVHVAKKKKVKLVVHDSGIDTDTTLHRTPPRV